MHFKFNDRFSVQRLLELMIIEYANRQDTTQEILSPLALALFMQVARQYKLDNPTDIENTLVEKIFQYMGEHIESVTLNSISAHFSYHPNYISSLIRKETGTSFSEMLNELRMTRAVSLLKGTTLSNEEISFMLGYSNSSNFYKAFRKYYHVTPREYI